MNDHLPVLSPGEIVRDIGSPLSIVIVSHRDEDIDQAAATFKQAGIGFKQQDRRMIRGKSLTLFLAILDVGG